MEAGGARISAQPLRLTRTVQLMQNVPPSPVSEAVPDPGKWRAWLATAAAVEIAHGIMTAWLRSRMPGYPGLPTPQLASGAPLGQSARWGQPYPWTRDERRQGLQFRDPPPEITRRLEATLPEERQITDATRVLGIALQGSTEWQRMGTAADALRGLSAPNSARSPEQYPAVSATLKCRSTANAPTSGRNTRGCPGRSPRRTVRLRGGVRTVIRSRESHARDRSKQRIRTAGNLRTTDLGTRSPGYRPHTGNPQPARKLYAPGDRLGRNTIPSSNGKFGMA